MIATYRKKPVEVQAVQWDGSNIDEIREFGAKVVAGPTHGFQDVLAIDTREGIMRTKRGSWIIRGVKGEFYPCEDEIFKLTYDAVEQKKKRG